MEWRQQPVGDDIEGVPVVDPPPNVPGDAMLVPTHGEAGVSAGAAPGAGSSGLMPALPSSVEPSGMVPMPSAEPPAVPPAVPLTKGFCVPDTVLPDGAELHGPDMPAFPPPSKVELAPAVPEPLTPGVTAPVTDVPFVPQVETPGVAPRAPGLRPPGLSSVEPKGIPTGPTEPVLPSGDVMPIPGAGLVEETCERAGAATKNSVAAAIDSRYLIQVSILCSNVFPVRIPPQPQLGRAGSMRTSGPICYSDKRPRPPRLRKIAEYSAPLVTRHPGVRKPPPSMVSINICDRCADRRRVAPGKRADRVTFVPRSVAPSNGSLALGRVRPYQKCLPPCSFCHPN
jgi:hypothetical protein